MNSTTDIEAMIKQANILKRLAATATGGLKGAGKGALLGGAFAIPIALATGMGLPAALGAGGAGMFSGAKYTGGLMGTTSALRNLFSRAPKNLAASTTKNIAQNLAKKVPANLAIPRGLPLIAGAGLGYALSDDDNKFLGSSLGAIAGLAARPALVKALERRAAGG